MNMEKYIKLMKACKAAYENLLTLHHNIVGKNFFADHEKLGEYYSLIADISDSIIENGISLGIKEPTISESLSEFEEIDTVERGAAESYIIVSETFNSLSELMENCREEVPDYLKSKFDEYQDKLNLEANYKIEHLLKG